MQARIEADLGIMVPLDTLIKHDISTIRDALVAQAQENGRLPAAFDNHGNAVVEVRQRVLEHGGDHVLYMAVVKEPETKGVLNVPASDAGFATVSEAVNDVARQVPGMSLLPDSENAVGCRHLYAIQNSDWPCTVCGQEAT